MSDRRDLMDSFLADAGMARWTRQTLAGDASTRRYTRLSHNGQSAIAMDAPPETGEDTRAFAQIGGYLSDLGPQHFAQWLDAHPQDSRQLYRAAADILVRLHQERPDFTLPELTPAVGGEMIALLNPFYADRPVDDLVGAMIGAMQELAPVADTIALRDFHAENLIWRPDRRGPAWVGLLDFQDALIAPAGYDLASLLRDARRDVAADIVSGTAAYFAEQTKPGNDFAAQLACLGAQRNLRILGVFARLAKTRNKPRYLALLPRVWSNLMLDLTHPALGRLRQEVIATLPEPDATHLARLHP